MFERIISKTLDASEWTKIIVDTNTDKQIRRQTDRHTDTQAHRHTDTQTHRHTHTDTEPANIPGKMKICQVIITGKLENSFNPG